MPTANEGFLYISTDNPGQQFKYGRITDAKDIVVCPGEIIKTVNIDGEMFQDIAPDIVGYAYGIKGTQVRIYWEPFQNSYNISTVTVIYPDITPIHLSQINFDLLDCRKCYYAIVTPEGNIILTYMTWIQNPVLKLMDLSEELAFENHLDIFACSDPMSILTMDKHYIFFHRNGQPYEFRPFITAHKVKS
jgi:hypothetical protein